MRTSMAYFLGAGTVVAAIVVGLGGGLLIANIVHPVTPKQGTETSLMERRTSPAPIQATTTTTAAPIRSTNAASEPVPNLAPQSTVPAAAAAASASTPANSGPAASPPADTAKVTAAVAPGAPSATAPSTSAAQEPRAGAPDDALAKAREADVRRDVETKPAADKRKFERRRQWAERRRYPRRPDQELDAVEQSVREDTEPRREFAVEPTKIEMPRIRLFEPQ